MTRLFLVYFFVTLCFLSFSYSLESNIKWSNDPDYLNVFVVPHSHNDPGWWFTFENYYIKWTKGIITSVIDALNQDPRRTFIWCETSFFSRWWKDQPSSVHETVKKLVRNKQLEFVGGGWVMNDEASVDIHQIINQYTAGHQWLIDNVGTEATPTTAWAIDPFGHSSAMAWAHREMGLDGMVINRVHQDIKQSWNKNQQLEFAWDRPWNMGNRSCVQEDVNNNIGDRWDGDGMLTHMLAYKLYDIPNTCGPDWDICATFDFERPVSVPITSENVKERSLTLLNQYRLKHNAFSHNNLLVPLGDDFKYKNLDITLKMMDNYQKMFDYINSDTSLKVRIRFATLNEYFDSIKNSINPDEIPRYDGDFFTYSDRDNDYWSGYFTTRPYLKKTIRTTEAQLHSAQILYSFASSYFTESEKSQNFHHLEECSQTLGLLQHHDAITGTAKQVVANDYIDLLSTAKSNVGIVSRKLMERILCDSNSVGQLIHIKQDQKGPLEPSYSLININTPKNIILFNSLSRDFHDVHRILINNCNGIIKDENGNIIPTQIVPYIESGDIITGKYWLYFDITVSSLSWKVIQVKIDEDSESISSVFDLKGEPISFCSKSSISSTSINIQNNYYDVNIGSSTGQIEKVTIRSSGSIVDFNQEYRTYGTKGGSYLFSPLGESTTLSISDNKGFIIKGSLLDLIETRSKSNQLGITTSLVKSSDELLSKRIMMSHHVNLDSTNYNNKELVSRLNTNLNGDIFWTDSAGLDMIERQYDSQRPIQANFYPLTTSAIKKDASSSLQLSIIVGHALGMGTRGNGIYELMLDRRTNQDDGRGMGERVTDQKPIDVNIWYVIDEAPGQGEKDIYFDKVPLLSQEMNYPLESLYMDSIVWSNSNCKSDISLIAKPFPSSVELFSMSPLSPSGEEIAIRFARLNPYEEFSVSNIDIQSIFGSSLDISNIEEKTASLLHTLETNINNLFVPSMSLRTFVLSITKQNTLPQFQQSFPITNEPIKNNEPIILPPAPSSTPKPKEPIPLILDDIETEKYNYKKPQYNENINILQPEKDIPPKPKQEERINTNSNSIVILTNRILEGKNIVSIPLSDYYFIMIISAITITILLSYFLFYKPRSAKRSLI